MAEAPIARVALLLQQRNTIDDEIAGIIDRPVTTGHLGEWLAAQIFDIELETSATTAGYDGRFRRPPLQGHTVNIKWYLKREGTLDTAAAAVDHYLVLTGPPGSAVSSRGTTRPWRIHNAYLFDAPQLHTELQARGVKQGIAASITRQQWAATEIYPTPSPRLPLTPEQAANLARFR